MKNKEIVKDILVAIHSVKSRAKKAYIEGNESQLYILLGDLYALEAVLVGETGKFMDELDKEAA